MNASEIDWSKAPEGQRISGQKAKNGLRLGTSWMEGHGLPC